MKFIQSIKGSAKRLLLAGAVSATMLGVGLGANAMASAESQNCDANAVVFCGGTTASALTQAYNSGDHHNSAASIQHIYSYFGITSAEMQSLSTTAQAGTVTKSGNVYVGNTLVATNAVTAGRENMPGSTQVTSGGTTFYTRTPNVSFQQSALNAEVVMVNGQFKFAILNSCGNPVKATPKVTPKPSYAIEKTVAPKGSANYVKSITVQNGSHVVYRVVVKNTGNTTLTNVKVGDVLPTHATYVLNTLTHDGKHIAAANFFASGEANIDLAPNQNTIFEFEAVISSGSTTACQAETLVNTARTMESGLPTLTSTATVSKQCQPTPTPTPETPMCTELEISTQSDTREVTISKFTVDTKSSTFVNAVIAWGENNQSTAAITDVNKVVGQTHTYQSDNTFVIQATVTFKLSNGDTVTSTVPACAKQVTFAPNTPPAVTPVTPETPATPETPSSLVNTGAGSTIGIFAAVSAVSALGYRWFLSRRLSA